MSDYKELTCIICPRGCALRVFKDGTVNGNSCPRGEVYGRQEALNPLRVLTTTVEIDSKSISRLPVRSSTGVPRAKQKELSLYLKKVKVHAPIKLNDVIVDKPLGLDTKIIAGLDVEE